MADQSDVETALATLVTGVLYPYGTTAPSITGGNCRIFRGWPNSASLDADLAAHRINVTIFPEAPNQEITTRWPDDFTVTATTAPTVTASVTGTTVTLGGYVTAGQVAGLLVDTLGVAYRVQDSDTLVTIAAALAADIGTVRTANASGPTITVPGAGTIVARIVADQPAIAQTRRQRQTFRITAWCPDPASRDLIASSIDAALSLQRFITLPDGLAARLRFTASHTFDQSQDAALYRRDLLYAADYATTVLTTLPSMLFGNATLSPSATGVTLNHLS